MNKPTEKQRKTIHAELLTPQNKRKKEPVEKQRKAIPQDRRHHGSVGANKPNEKLRKTTQVSVKRKSLRMAADFQKTSHPTGKAAFLHFLFAKAVFCE